MRISVKALCKLKLGCGDHHHHPNPTVEMKRISKLQQTLSLQMLAHSEILLDDGCLRGILPGLAR
jgi:hypothetical protein